MMTKKAYTKIVNFMDPRVGVVLQGFGHIVDVVKMLLRKFLIQD